MVEVLNIKENNDGSATLNLDLTEYEKQALIEYAIIDILKKRCKEEINRSCIDGMLDMSEDELDIEESEKYTGP